MIFNKKSDFFLSMIRVLQTIGCWFAFPLLRPYYRHVGSSSLRRHQPKSIIFLAWGGIGNVVMMEPAFGALRKAWPHAYITVIVLSEATAQVMRLFPNHSDEVRIYPISRQDSFWIAVNYGHSLRFMNADILVAARGIDALIASTVGWAAGTIVRVGEDRRGRGIFYTHTIPAKENSPAVDANGFIVARIGVNFHSRPPRLLIDTLFKKKATQLITQAGVKISTRPIIGLHMGSDLNNASTRRWPINKTLDLIDQIENRWPGFQLLFFFGPDEKELITKLRSFLSRKVRILEELPDIGTLAAAISMCRLFISTDSGPMHIAYAVGVPVAVLFGPTNIIKHGPYGPGHFIVTPAGIISTTELRLDDYRSVQGPIDQINVDDVLEAIEKLV